MTPLRRIGGLARAAARAGAVRRVRDERGSLSVVVVMWSLVIMMVAAVVIDGGLAISQRERAADLADQAARAEAQNIEQDTLRSSGAALIGDDGCARAAAYLQSAAGSIHYGTASLDPQYGNEGATGNLTGNPIANSNGTGDGCELSAAAPGEGNSVTVEVQLTYSPFVFDLFGGTVTVTESGTAIAATGD